MGAGIAGLLARAGLTGRRSSTRASSSPSRRASGCSSARAGTSTPGCSTRRRSSGRRRSTAPAQPRAPRDLVIEAVPEDLELKQRGPERDRAGPRSSPPTPRRCRSSELAGVGARAGALPRRALVQPAGVDARDRGHHLAADRTARSSSRSMALRCARSASARRRSRTVPGSSPTACRSRCCARRCACVEEDLATPEAIDEVVRSTFGFRLPFYGPFEIADMAGLDVYESVFRTLERDLGPAFAPPRRCASRSTQGAARDQDRRGLRRLRRRRRARSSSATGATPQLASLLAELDAGVVGERRERAAWRPAARSPNGSLRVAGQRAVGQAVGGAGGEDVLRRAAQHALRRVHAAAIWRTRGGSVQREQESAPAAGTSASPRGSRACSVRRTCSRPSRTIRAPSRVGRLRAASSVAPARRVAQRVGELLADEREAVDASPARRRTRRRRAPAVSRAVAEIARPESWIPRPTLASSRIPSWTLTPSHANTISSEDDGEVAGERPGRPGRRRGIEAHGAQSYPKTKGRALRPALSSVVPRPSCGEVLTGVVPATRRPEPARVHARAGPRRSGPRWSPRP